jgi:hypothetical protein
MFFGYSRGQGFTWNSLALAKRCKPWIVLSNKLLFSPNKDCMQKLRPWEVDVSTNYLGVCNTYGVSSSRVRVFASLFFRIHDKRPF